MWSRVNGVVVGLILGWTFVIGSAAREAGAGEAGAVTVTDIKAVCRHGQTFVTWMDAAEGEAGSRYRYSLYRSDEPITQENLAQAEFCYPGVLNNSCKQFGYAYSMKDRLDPRHPTYILEEGGEPLPLWSGVAVRTIRKDGRSFYAVMVTDEQYRPVGRIVPGQSATTGAVEERVAPIQPIAVRVSTGSAAITGKEKLPLMLSLHGSQARGGPSAMGNVFVYFGTPEMGWRDGIPGSFAVFEQRGKMLTLGPRDAIENPDGNGAVETCWFGYACVPVGASHQEPRAYPFTENRLDWMVAWVIARYKADPLRVYSGGQSMGGMGSTQWAFRRPDIFAAVYPRLGRIRQTWRPVVPKGPKGSLNKALKGERLMLFDGTSDYYIDKMDAAKYAYEHKEDLPFYAFCCGRRDWVETWKANIEMVQALTASRHGFALAWTNGGHDDIGAKGRTLLQKYYPPSKFARDRSFPAFGNSSIDDNMGSGELDENKALKDGDLVGGINLGFDWQDVVDEEGKWSAKISNDLCQKEMTVDVTPRWCQRFKPRAGEKFQWTDSAGGEGEVTADQWGLVTVAKLRLRPGEATALAIARQ
jgi:pimeloyl-ACP methyl ester carboxylesterase